MSFYEEQQDDCNDAYHEHAGGEAFAGCLGGDDEDDTPDWSISMASDVSADFVESAWDPIIPNLNAGDMCDAIISAMTKTDEREQAVDFTRAYYTSSQGVIGGSGAASISEVADLNAAGTTIGVQSGPPRICTLRIT